MEIVRKSFILSLGIFFLWLTINIPDINMLFFLDISNLSDSQRVLLQYSSLVAYSGSMIWMALEGADV